MQRLNLGRDEKQYGEMTNHFKYQQNAQRKTRI